MVRCGPGGLSLPMYAFLIDHEQDLRFQRNEVRHEALQVRMISVVVSGWV